MKHSVVIATLALVIGLALALYGKKQPAPKCDNPNDKIHLTYSHGVNDALECIMLLDLELDLKSERKTWGEMCDIVRKRLNVKESK